MRPIDIKISVLPGTFITLGEHLLKHLSALRSAPSIDRYMPTSGVWKEIKWNTPFSVRDGSVIAVKSSKVTLKDWDIHAPHIFDN